MKTSNIILSSVIGSITLVIVCGFMQLRLTGETSSRYTEQVYADIKLSEFRYLVIKDAVNLTIRPADEVKLLIQNASGQDKPDVAYHESGDTLFIDRIKFGPEDRTLFVTIKTPVKTLEWIGAENAAFSITDFPIRYLNVDLAHSRMTIHAENPVNMGTLKITGENDSHIHAYQVMIDTIDLHLDQSEAMIQSKINKLKGAMMNNSSLNARDVDEFAFRKDSTSRFN